MWNSKVEPYLADFGILYTIIRYHVSIHFISSVSYDIYYKQYSLLKKGGEHQFGWPFHLYDAWVMADNGHFYLMGINGVSYSILHATLQVS